MTIKDLQDTQPVNDGIEGDKCVELKRVGWVGKYKRTFCCIITKVPSAWDEMVLLSIVAQRSLRHLTTTISPLPHFRSTPWPTSLPRQGVEFKWGDSRCWVEVRCVRVLCGNEVTIRCCVRWVILLLCGHEKKLSSSYIYKETVGVCSRILKLLIVEILMKGPCTSRADCPSFKVNLFNFQSRCLSRAGAVDFCVQWDMQLLLPAKIRAIVHWKGPDNPNPDSWSSWRSSTNRIL